MKKLFLVTLTLITSYSLSAQVAVNTSGNSAHSKAMLDVTTTDKGMLIPRMTEAQRDAINPDASATGLMIYQTDQTPGFYYYDGSVWTTMSGSNATHYIGENYQGGIIFWLDATGQHGLIASATDQNNGEIPWYNGIFRFTGAVGQGLYSGAMNTSIIVPTLRADNGESSIFAALVCANYGAGDGSVWYSDWYLPSEYELNLLYLQKSVVGGFTDGTYWSSTDNTTGKAWSQRFSDGQQFLTSKYILLRVRPIRAF